MEHEVDGTQRHDRSIEKTKPAFVLDVSALSREQLVVTILYLQSKETWQCITNFSDANFSDVTQLSVT